MLGGEVVPVTSSELAFPSMSIDAEANAAALRLRAGRSARSERVHRSVVADFDEHEELLSVELLSLSAIRVGEVVDCIHRLVADAGHLHAYPENVWPIRQVSDWADLFVRQVWDAWGHSKVAAAGGSTAERAEAAVIRG